MEQWTDEKLTKAFELLIVANSGLLERVENLEHYVAFLEQKILKEDIKNEMRIN